MTRSIWLNLNALRQTFKFYTRPVVIGVICLGVAVCAAPKKPQPAPLPVAPKKTPQEVVTGQELPLEQQARAFKITSAQTLLEGPQAQGRVGDYKLENRLVSFVVSDIVHATGFALTGGQLIDAASLDPLSGAPKEDALSQNLLYLNDTFGRQAVFTHISMVSLPASPGSATIRVEGHDSANPQIAIRQDFTLEPESSTLLMHATLSNLGTTIIKSYRFGDAFQWGRASHYGPEYGFDLTGVKVKLPWLAAVAPHTSYAVLSAEGDMDTYSGDSWSDVTYATLDLQPKSSVILKRYLVVGTGDVASVFPDISWQKGSNLFDFSGNVKFLSDKRSVTSLDAPVYLHLYRKDNKKPFAFVRAQADGHFFARIPEGDYLVSLEGLSVKSTKPVPLSLKKSVQKDFTISLGGQIRINVVENNQKVPAKITILGVPPTPHPTTLSGSLRGASSQVLWTHDGQVDVILPPGKYQFLASRGPEYELSKQVIVVKSGSEQNITFDLHHVIETGLYVSADFHQHSINSADAAVSLVDRVVSNAAEGLQVMVSSDHHACTDYKPIIEQLKLTQTLTSVIGQEVTTSDKGHFVVFPSNPDKALLPPVLYQKDVTQLFSLMKAMHPQALIQVNHPRENVHSGYFSAMQLDTQELSKHLPEYSDQFDMIEVYNGKHDDQIDAVLSDWMHWATRGKFYTLTGGSDSHTLTPDEVGYPRNYVRLQKPWAQFSNTDFVQAIKNKQVIVSNGPLIELFVGDEAKPTQIGETLSTKDTQIELRYKLQAASWVPVTHIEFWQDGQKIQTISVQNKPQEMTYAEGAFPIQIKKTNSYVLAIVKGEKPLESVVRTIHPKGRYPFAITNPIFIKKI